MQSTSIYFHLENTCAPSFHFNNAPFCFPFHIFLSQTFTALFVLLSPYRLSLPSIPASTPSMFPVLPTIYSTPFLHPLAQWFPNSIRALPLFLYSVITIAPLVGYYPCTLNLLPYYARCFKFWPLTFCTRSHQEIRDPQLRNNCFLRHHSFPFLASPSPQPLRPSRCACVGTPAAAVSRKRDKIAGNSLRVTVNREALAPTSPAAHIRFSESALSAKLIAVIRSRPYFS